LNAQKRKTVKTPLRAKKKKQSREIKTGRKVELTKAEWKNEWVADSDLKRDEMPKESPEIKCGRKVKPAKAQWENQAAEPELTKPSLNEYQMIRLLIDFLGTYEAAES
jgi:hypothetical protein